MVLGDLDHNLMGRGTTALLVAVQNEADLFLMGSAGVEVDGVMKSQAMLEKTLLRASAVDTLDFSFVEDFAGVVGRHTLVGSFISILDNAILDETLKEGNTDTVAQWACETINQHTPQELVRLHVVCDEAHLSATQRVLSELRQRAKIKLLASFVFSEVPYSEGGASDCLTLEPPLTALIGPQVKQLIVENKHRVVEG